MLPLLLFTLVSLCLSLDCAVMEVPLRICCTILPSSKIIFIRWDTRHEVLMRKRAEWLSNCGLVPFVSRVCYFTFSLSVALSFFLVFTCSSFCFVLILLQTSTHLFQVQWLSDQCAAVYSTVWCWRSLSWCLDTPLLTDLVFHAS